MPETEIKSVNGRTLCDTTAREMALDAVNAAERCAEFAEEIKNEVAALIGMPTFHIGEDGRLYVTYPDRYSGATFRINSATGNLEEATECPEM